MAFQKINSLLFQPVEPPAPLSFLVAFHNPRADRLARLPAMSLLPSPETHSRHVAAPRTGALVLSITLSLFGHCACVCACAKICFGDYTTVRRRDSTGPSGEGQLGLTSQLLLLESLLPGCSALPGSRAGGAGRTQAPCGLAPIPSSGGPYM